MFLTVTAFVLFIFLLAATRSRIKNNHLPSSRLPPGPWKLPLIGNMYQLAIQQQAPHRFLKDLTAKYGPIMHLKLGEVSTYVISSAELARQVFKDHDLVFAQRPQTLATSILSYGSIDIVFSEHGDYWRQLRKICILELLSSKRVQSFKSVREEGVSDLIRMISQCHCNEPINVSQMIFSLIYGITAKAAFGKKCKDQEAFIANVKEMVKLMGGFFITDMYPSLEFLSVLTGMKRKLENQHKSTDMILEEIIKDHREGSDMPLNNEADDDLVDVLLRIQRNRNLPFPLTDNNLKAVILDVFSAGSETSSTTAEWAMSELIKNPDIMKKAQMELRQVFDKKGYIEESSLQELKYLKLIIKETLRLHPPAPLLVPREAREACDLGGYHIPAKSKLIINAWAIAQSSQYWDEPEKFLPERFENSSVDYKGTDFQFIPFGAGRRICPGIAFAIASIGLPLAQLLYHFNWRVPSGRNEELDMDEEFGITVRRKNDLFLIPHVTSNIEKTIANNT